MQEPMEQQLQEWAEYIGNFKLPRWNTLPEIELYMDQIIMLIEKHLSGLLWCKKNLLTPAMVNNYVKLGLIPKPIKKKYNRKHLSHLIVITLLKELFAIGEIKVAIEIQTDREGTGEAAYNLFCMEIEQALAAASAEMLGKSQPVTLPVEPRSRLLRMAARAFACRSAANQEVILHYQNQQNNQQGEYLK